MKIRIMGTSEEVKQLAELLPAIMKVSSVSGEYPNRGSSDVRVYVDGEMENHLPLTNAIQKFAEYKEQIGAMIMNYATPEERLYESFTATSKKAYLSILTYLTGEEFYKSLVGHAENFALAVGVDVESVKAKFMWSEGEAQ